MEARNAIKIERCAKSRIDEVDFKNLGFGNYVTDHMLMADYYNQQWNETQIVPFQSITLSPTALVFHYGQTVFEGMKAFRMQNGQISIFRMEAHWHRFNLSLQRMCMPEVPYELFSKGIESFISIDSNWLKDSEGMSLYIRPFMFATEERYGVKISESYKFIVFAGAVGKYYSKPLRVKVEETFVRASKGGTGTAKCGGNYGGAFYPTLQAQKQGFDQVLWTDGSQDCNIEESGTMNVMFVIDGKIVTPALSGSILGGVTRDSLLKLAKNLGYKIEERKISAHELRSLFEEDRIQEAFGTGTAAVTACIESISIFGSEYKLPIINENSCQTKLHKLLSDIRLGIEKDIFNWNYVI